MISRATTADSDRIAVPQEVRKAIEVGERRGRPFDLHLSHGLNAGVPHVSSHFTTSSCGTVAWPGLYCCPPSVQLGNSIRTHRYRSAFDGNIGEKLGYTDTTFRSAHSQGISGRFI